MSEESGQPLSLEKIVITIDQDGVKTELFTDGPVLVRDLSNLESFYVSKDWWPHYNVLVHLKSLESNALRISNRIKELPKKVRRSYQ